MDCQITKIRNMIENKNNNKTLKKLPKMMSFFDTKKKKYTQY